MFDSKVYSARRDELRKKIKSGIGLFIGNVDSPMNYPSNQYHFRQDSDFLYYFGIDLPGFIGVIDFDSGKEYLHGNDFDMDDIVWMGPQPTVRELASKCGITDTGSLASLDNERDIFGIVEGIAFGKGYGTSFPTILSINGQTLHNHSHINDLKTGRMMVTDAGAESELHYASDITRTTPVGGKFGPLQKEIYEIVLQANLKAIDATKPGLSNRDIHFLACKTIASGLKDVGLMKGSTDDAVSAGAHALFMPHGIGHMLGLDVHDMEALGENFVGYNDEIKRSTQFGTSFLRFALQYKPGHVFTIEPGIYFIPELIEMWKAEGKFSEFINYEKLTKYMEIGGVRIEDDVVIIENGHKVLGKPIPKTTEEVEQVCATL